MDIGTAKPSVQERAQVPFHLLDIASPDDQITVSDWKHKAEASLKEIEARGRRSIICGGTGLYFRALLDDWKMAETAPDPSAREKLMQELADQGPEALHERLRSADPATAVRLHQNDTFRVVRALEVCLTTGRPISEIQAEDRAGRPARPSLHFALTMPRPLLNLRIEARVDKMITDGLLEEVKGLLDQGYSGELGPMKSLGYREMVEVLVGKSTCDDAVEEMKSNTRRFAKRQQTWFRADPLLNWLDVSELSSAVVANSLRKEIEAQDRA